MNVNLICVAALFTTAPLAYPAIIGTNSPARVLTIERVAALPADQQPAWKKYWERSVRQMRKDKDFLIAEMKKHGLTDSLPAPKGQRESRLLLNQPAAWYGEAEALRIADIVISFQTPAGGWCKGVDMIQNPRAPGGQFFGDHSTVHRDKSGGATRISQWNYIGTFDNGATTTQLRYLAKVVNAVGPKRSARYRAAFFRGVDYILAAQFPNGGWPQVWPLEGGYHDAITYNDGAMINVLQLLTDIADGKNEFAFVPAKIRARTADGVQRGIKCILETQIVVQARRTVWCQQHDALTLQPTAARDYEMPSQCSSESAGILMFLMRLPDPTPPVIAALHAAAAWFEKTKLHDVAYKMVGEEGKQLVPSPGSGLLWARYYEIGTDRPIFGDRDQTIHDNVNEISKERRDGYSWFSDAPGKALAEFVHWNKTEH